VIDSMLRRGELEEVNWMRGTPTIMIGGIEDPNFEEHLKEGPYVVFDDAAFPRYKNDPRVHFVPGHPVLRDAMPELQKGLGVSLPGKIVEKGQQWRLWGMHATHYGTPLRKAKTVMTPLAIAAAALAGFVGAVVFADRMLLQQRKRQSTSRRVRDRISNFIER
jgi:hypothetical protein